VEVIVDTCNAQLSAPHSEWINEVSHRVPL